MECSVVLPAYNEANIIALTLKRVKSALDALGYDYEIIVADNGSTDGTTSIVSKLVDNERIRHLIIEKKGRGRALNIAIKHARSNIVLYMDVDLATDLKHIPELVGCIERGYDIATGSRLLEGSVVKRSFMRDIASRCYNMLCRTLFGINIHDMQCGFKAFKKDSILKILDKVDDTEWFWDTEVLIRASREGYRIAEIPIVWKEGSSSKVKILRDSIKMGSKLFMLRIKLIAQSLRKGLSGPTNTLETSLTS